MKPHAVINREIVLITHGENKIIFPGVEFQGIGEQLKLGATKSENEYEIF